jgi:aromatic-L-amino-acid decarboxylase
MRDLVERAAARVIAHVESLPEQPLHRVAGGKKLAALLREPIPEQAVPVERALRLLFGRVIPATFNTASGGYLAYIPGGGLFASAVADFIALATNRYAGVWVAGPGLVQIEQNVIGWFAAELGLPATSGGLLTTGGSMANLIALVTARRERLPPDFLRGVIYASDQVHHSVEKAALIAGFPPENIRSLRADGAYRLDPAALERAVEEDRGAGRTPFCVVASAGTTNTGAVDPLDDIAEVAARAGLWLHVDAAYGGFFALTQRGKEKLRGIERADSVTLDPHKGLFLPYGTGCVLVRDRAALRRAHAVHAAYMPPMQDDDSLVDFCDLGPELSREWRGLRVWLPLKLHGAKAFRDALDEKLDLAARALRALETMPEIEVLAPPELSLLAFRWHPPGIDDEDVLERANRELIAAVNERQRVFITGAKAQGRYFLRICILSFRTHADRVDACVQDLRAALDEVGARWRASKSLE